MMNGKSFLQNGIYTDERKQLSFVLIIKITTSTGAMISAPERGGFVCAAKNHLFIKMSSGYAPFPQ